MSSPFPSHPTSSPFTFPHLAHPSPLPQGQGQGQPVQTGPIFAPSPLSQLISSSIIPSFATPSASGALGTGTGVGISPSGSYPFAGAGITPNTSAILTAAANASLGIGLPPTGTAGVGVGVGAGASDVTGLGMRSGQGGDGGLLIGGMADAEVMLSRLEGVLAELKLLEGRVFTGAQEGDGARIQGLHAEYTQVLISLITLSQTHLFGALPALPSSPTHADPHPHANIAVDPSSDVNGGLQNEAVPNPSSAPTAPTFAELTRWAEDRASLEFTRREALKAGSKAVLDVLRASSGR
ncbi:hypothetical protein IAR55_002052 [Kwoniella newhampshirensis]|uniref:Mediator complex subunit 11 n=1 Tax=Kwoniella newhampshirensis TaxID=1651941 RepID=A0AAW0Z0U2_9TREE